MTFKRAHARIAERSTTSGSGPWMLGGAFDSSYNAFSSFLSDGDSTEISVVEPGVAFWTGIGTYTASTNSIAPTTVEETSGTFGAGTKEIFAGSLAARHLVKEDMAGAIVTGGTSTAYTVSSFRQYDTLTRLHGNAVAFSPHTANGQTVTLNVDGLGAKPLRLAPGVELQSNTLIAGTPYTALYNHTDDAFYLHALSAGNTYGVPIGAGLDYWASTTPSSCFVFPTGQALSRTVYASLFGGNPWSIGTTYGSGDGSTTFNLPDARGYSRIMLDGAIRIPSSVVPNNLGGTGGEASHPLIAGEIPSITSTGTFTANSSLFVASNANSFQFSDTGGGPQVFQAFQQGAVMSRTAPTGPISVTSGGTNGTAHNNLQPMIFCNYIMRVI